MSGRLFEISVKAEGEVRDKDGALLSSTPVEFETIVVTEAEARAMGLLDEGDKQ